MKSSNAPERLRKLSPPVAAFREITILSEKAREQAIEKYGRLKTMHKGLEALHRPDTIGPPVFGQELRERLR